MIEPIVIKVTDKVPEIISGPEYVVCDNSDYTVVWQLDEEWAQFEHRTMQVNYKDGTYERVLFTGDSCTLPAIPVPGPVHVGLFAGDIHTTRPARLLAVRSATTDSGEERAPMPNGYAQAIEALDAKLDKNQGAENAGKALVVGDDGNVVPGEAQGSSLPTMSSDTAGKMLTNDGEKAEWGGAVRYDVHQSLTDTQATQARNNIGLTPVAKTDNMTQSVGLDAETGELWTNPGAEAYTLPVASATQLGGVKPTAKTDEMTQQVGVDEDGALYTKPGKASGPVQSDWQQNDETAQDYVKNRPGGYDTTEINITWDGNTAGKEITQSEKNFFVRVSARTPSKSELLGGTISLVNRSYEEEEVEVIPIDESIVTEVDGALLLSEVAFIVYNPPVSFDSYFFNQSGVWFAGQEKDNTPDLKMFASLLRRSPTPVKIPKRYLELDVKEVIVVNFTKDDDNNWQADRSWEEVFMALVAGAAAYATLPNGAFYPLYWVQPETLMFLRTTLLPNVSKNEVTQVTTEALGWKANGDILFDNAVSTYVGYDRDQSLTADKQAQARKNIGLTPVAKNDAMTQSVGLDADTGELWTVPPTGDNIVLASSTTGSTKKFRITVNDSGTLSAVEVTDAS